jgi:DNA-directed RNA polymerase subunit RPC12/RpoP
VSAKESAVVTEKRAEVKVEEIEITRYKCYNCGQRFEEDEVLTIGLGFDGSDSAEERIICSGCGRALFDFDNEFESIDYIRESFRRFDGRDIAVSLLGVAVSLLPIVFAMGMAYAILTTLPSAMETMTQGLMMPAESSGSEANPDFMDIFLLPLAGFAALALLEFIRPLGDI